MHTYHLFIINQLDRSFFRIEVIYQKTKTSKSLWWLLLKSRQEKLFNIWISAGFASPWQVGITRLIRLTYSVKLVGRFVSQIMCFFFTKLTNNVLP